MRRFGASNARRCARPEEVIAPMAIATTRSAIPCRQRELPGQASVSPQQEKDPAPDPIDLSRNEPMKRDGGD